MNRNIIIFILILLANISFAQSYSNPQNIIVSDINGNPIPNVFIFSQTHQVLTNEDGTVTITITENNEIFFQHIGYTTTSFTLEELQATGFNIILENKENYLKEIELVGRTGKKKREIFQELETIKLSDMPLNLAQSTPELLENNSGVFMQKTQMGGGSPVVRGFEANRLLLVQDGVRLNNAIYRSGHLHNILSIDDTALEKIDLIYGPASLNYGSDAIGGVLHFVSKQPQLSQKFVNYYSSYATANNGIKTALDLNISNNKIASLTSLSYANYGDLKTGNSRTEKYPDFGKRKEYVITENGLDQIVQNSNPNKQVYTGYKQWNISNRTKYIANDHLSLSSNIQYSTSTDIPRYDFLSEYKNDILKYAEWNYGPQERLFISGTIDWYKPTKFYNQVKTIISYQKIKEERIKRQYKKDERSHNIEDLGVYGITFDFIKDFRKKQKLTYGVDLQYNDLVSSAHNINIHDKNKITPILTRYPNGENAMVSTGVYFNYYLHDFFKHFDANIGLRYQYTNVKLGYKKNNIINWPAHYYDGISTKNDALTGSVALKWNPSPIISVNWMSATAFRSPNIDDIAKIRVKRGEISMANLDLTPERSINHELSTTIKPIEKKDSYINVALYSTYMKDAIIRSGYELDGSNKFIRDNDTLDIVANVNAAKAVVYGISLQTKVDIIDPISLKIGYTKIIGSQYQNPTISSNDSTPLSHIPPAYGKAGLIYHKNKLVAGIKYKYYGSKPVEEYGDSSDNFENATKEGTPSYHLFDIEAAYSFNDKLKVNLGVQNIFDTHYRLFSSGVSGAGRNIVISVTGTI